MPDPNSAEEPQSGAPVEGRAAGCLLCAAEKISHWYFEDEICWVADCDSCDTVMVVWRSHGMPTDETEAQMVEALRGVAEDEFGSGGYWIDPIMRNIPDHWHCHARPAGGFFGTGFRRRPAVESS